MDLRSTLNLPDPNFTIPMKADLPNLEPKIQARWNEEGIYHMIQKARAGAPTFVFHDGPPYTNSPIHIGTAMNKILKDFAVKSHTMLGYRVPYVPGFDNHGLPIEQTVMRNFHEQKIKPSITELRVACREHAAKYIDVQTEQFKRLGVFALWEKPYTTMSFRFEAEIVRVFKRLVEGGYVYKGLRPTLWSPTSQTALADTEIIYRDHVSKSIFVRFPILDDPNKLFREYENLYTIIWTTTPWTIPANLAVAFHPTFSYVVVRVRGQAGPELQNEPEAHYLIAEGLLGRVAEKLGWTDYAVVENMDGITLEHSAFAHPIFGRPSLSVMAEYVTLEDGTGVVHTAPSHGRDDFYTGQKYNLGVPTTVDERGYLTAETGEFEGVYYKDCDKIVVDRLRDVGALMNVGDYPHSYPYAERDEKPVIFRATEQWFVGMDHNGLRDRMLAEIKNVSLDDFGASSTTALSDEARTKDKGVSWVPETGYNRIHAMVINRPDWCISRQRPWGVGIPVFYGAKSREPVLDPLAIESVAQLVEREGSDAWFEKPAAEILPNGYTHPATGETEFAKETDVLDVWFDSGSTSLCVLEGNVESEWKEHWPADLYFEGSDQHRGWFNSSLIIGTAVKGQAPYRQVVTHGFVVDEKGIKLSKRLGNSIDPVQACGTYGADVLRYWMASVDYANDVPCYDALLKQFGEQYRTVRNTLRFLLGNLEGYTPIGGEANVLELDEWAMEQVDLLVDDCARAYARYDYNTVISSVHNFCVKELSRFYLDAIKDRMYCEAKESQTRRSGQIACHYVLTRLLKLLTPILVHTAEETWMRMMAAGLAPQDGPGTIHAEKFDVPTPERLEVIEGSDLQVKYARLRGIREDVFAAFEQWKGTADVKDSQDVVATVTESGELLETLKSFDPYELANLFKMSWIELNEGDAGVMFRKSEFLKCERSRLRRPDVELVDGVPLTKRDRTVLGL